MGNNRIGTDATVTLEPIISFEGPEGIAVVTLERHMKLVNALTAALARAEAAERERDGLRAENERLNRELAGEREG